MLVKSARRYINTLDKILKSQHNDIITKTTEYNDYDISYIKLNFHIEGCYCFVSAHNNSDTITYYVTGCDDVIEYIISDNETQKDSMYTILNRLYDIVVRLTTETEETEEAEETEDTTETEETHLTKTAGSTKRKADNQAYNSMCYNCKKFLNGCIGEKNKIYSGCVYKEKMEVRNNG